MSKERKTVSIIIGFVLSEDFWSKLDLSLERNLFLTFKFSVAAMLVNIEVSIYRYFLIDISL